MAYKRLFVALAIDSERLPSLVATARKLRIHADKHEMNIKWSPPGNWHVTLLFLGDAIDGDRLPRLEERLKAAAARTPAFDARLIGLGAFPDERHARVIWAGLSRTQELLDAQSAVEEEFADEFSLTESASRHIQDFRPHVTLGRMRSTGSVREMIAPFERRHFGDERIDRLVLYESTPQGHFPVYTPLFSAALLSN